MSFRDGRDVDIRQEGDIRHDVAIDYLKYI